MIQKIKGLFNSSKAKIKKICKTNEKGMRKVLGKTFITIIRIIVEKLLDKLL